MARLLLRNLFDLVLRIRLIRTHLCHRRRMPVLMSLLRLLFRMLTCHRVTQMFVWIRMIYLLGLLMTHGPRVFRMMTLRIHLHLLTQAYLVIPFPIRHRTVPLVPSLLTPLSRRASLFRLPFPTWTWDSGV